MNLSLRLQTALNLLDKNKVLADIGCDHGLLSISYAMENYPTKVFAIDEKKLPLDSCIENIKFFQRKGAKLDNIVPTLSSGFNKLDESVRQILVCGVGGDNIVNMFKENPAIINYVDTFVFQANNNIPYMRKYLNSIGLKIVEEKIIEEDNLIYEIIKFVKGKQDLNEKEIYFGPILLKEKGEIFEKKYQTEILKLEKTMNKIPSNYEDKVEKFKKEIDFIKDNI